MLGFGFGFGFGFGGGPIVGGILINLSEVDSPAFEITVEPR